MNDIKKIIDNLDIVKLISETVVLKKAGVNYQGLCPFHVENTPSFVVSPKKKIFKCFGCNASGDAISFYMKKNSLSFMEAVNEFASKMGITLTLSKKNNKDVLDILKEIAVLYKNNLFSEKGKIGLDYFKNERKFSDNLIQESYLGYSNGNLFNLIKSKNYPVETIKKLGLIKNGYEFFKDRVIFTIFNYAGEVIGFGGRALNNKVLPKYINSSESEVFNKGSNLYGIFDRNDIRSKDYAILVEGYTDVLALRDAGIKNAVASLGTSLTEKQANLLKKLTYNVVVMYDNDNAGLLATERAIFILKKQGFSVKISVLEYKDPDEFLKHKDVGQLKSKIKNAVEAFDFLFEIYSKKYRDVLDKKVIVERFKEFFVNLASELDVEIYLQKLSLKLDISKEILSAYIKLDKTSDTISGKMDNIRRYLNSLELDTLAYLLKKKRDLSKFSKYLEHSAISFLLKVSEDSIEEEINSFVGVMGYDFMSISKQYIDDFVEFEKNLLSSWGNKEINDQLNEIEYLSKDSDRMDTIKKYYEKKKEKEKLNG